MPPDGTYTAVLDRFEGDLAVLVLEADGDPVDDLAVPTDDLPEPARRQDAVLRVVIEDGDPVDLEFREEETSRRTEDRRARFDRLSRRRPGDDDEDGDASAESGRGTGESERATEGDDDPPGRPDC